MRPTESNRAPKRCDYTIYAQAAVLTQGWEAGTATVTHQYYIPGVDATSTGSWAEGPAGTPGCPGPAPADLLVQRVTISLTSPDGRVQPHDPSGEIRCLIQPTPQCRSVSAMRE